MIGSCDSFPDFYSNKKHSQKIVAHLAKKSVKIRVIRIIRVPIIRKKPSQTTGGKSAKAFYFLRGVLLFSFNRFSFGNNVRPSASINVIRRTLLRWHHDHVLNIDIFGA